MQFNCHTIPLSLLLRIKVMFMAVTDRRETATLESDFAALVSRQRRLIDRLCFAYARSAEELDDLRQDTLINLWKAMPAFRHQSSESTWIYRITLNTCVSALRLRSRQPATTSLLTLYDVIDEPDDKAVVIQKLHEAISTLSPLDKSIMLMWLDELPYDEIARITGLPRNTVATRLRRGKQQLKHLIDPSELT